MFRPPTGLLPCPAGNFSAREHGRPSIDPCPKGSNPPPSPPFPGSVSLPAILKPAIDRPLGFRTMRGPIRLSGASLIPSTRALPGAGGGPDGDRPALPAPGGRLRHGRTARHDRGRSGAQLRTTSCGRRDGRSATAWASAGRRRSTSGGRPPSPASRMAALDADARDDPARAPTLRALRRRTAGRTGNPLGPRALYLYRTARDTLYRLHGTTEPHTSARWCPLGCVRFLNQDIIDLYVRVPVGDAVRGPAATGTAAS